jgi:lipopolysaccharide transport system permease protein
MSEHRARPRDLVRSLYTNRRLIFELSKRDTLGRYKGSILGVLWSLVTPILMLAVYTLVFSGIFHARWGSTQGSRSEFATMLFAGLIVFNIFGESVNRAPSVIVANVNFVKKVIFPLEILPCVNLLSALYHAGISVLVLLLFEILFGNGISLTFWMLPIAMLPLAMFTLGVSWALAATGVYLRDISQTIGVAVTALLFLSGVFFPLSAVSDRWRGIAKLNPLALAIELGRDVLVVNQPIDWVDWGIYTACAALIGWLGFVWFQKVRGGFADVL